VQKFIEVNVLRYEHSFCVSVLSYQSLVGDSRV